MPTWYLCLTVVVVATGEELLYRGYAIGRLQAVTGSLWLAAALSLAASSLSHLPLWGLGASLTSAVSGGIVTALYVWRKDVAFLVIGHVLTDLYGLVFARCQRHPTRWGLGPASSQAGEKKRKGSTGIEPN